MGYKFNPFTGTLDEVGSSGSSGISFADLATPPVNTMLGSSGAPFMSLDVATYTPSGQALNPISISGGDDGLGDSAIIFSSPIDHYVVLSSPQFMQIQATEGIYFVGGGAEIAAQSADLTKTARIVLQSPDSGALFIEGYEGVGTNVGVPDIEFFANKSTGNAAPAGFVLVSTHRGISGSTVQSSYVAFDVDGVKGVSVANGLPLGFSSIDDASNAVETGFAWVSSGVLKLIGTGAGFYGSLNVLNLSATGVVTATDFIVSGSRFKSDTVDGHTAGLAGYDVDNTTYRDILTWTNGNAVAAVLATPVGGTLSGEFSTLTLGGNAVATQTYVNAQGFITSSALTGYALLNSPSFTTPSLNVASATSINKVAITAPATSATLTILNGKTLTANNSVILAGTDGKIMTFPSTDATIARTDAGQTFTGLNTFIANGTSVTTAQTISLIADASEGWSRNGSAHALISSGANPLMVGWGHGIKLASGQFLSWSSNVFAANSGNDLFLGRAAAATIQLGVDINSAAVAQTLQSCRGITGTDKTGAPFHLTAGPGTGAATVSYIDFNTPTVGSTGTTQQTAALRLTIDSAGVKCSAPLWVNNAAVTGLVAGALAALTTASIVIYDSTGQAYRIPCVI